MGTIATRLTTQWQLIGSTPLDIETNTTARVYLTVSDDVPTTDNYSGHMMGGNGVYARTFDADGLNVYAKTDNDDLEVNIVSVPRSDIGKMLASLKQNLLVVDPDTMDVFIGDKDGR